MKKVVIEEFDDEGNLVKRTTTEYDSIGGVERGWEFKPYVGEVWPYTGQWISGTKVTSWN